VSKAPALARPASTRMGSATGILSIAREDVDQAKDVLKTFQHSCPAPRGKGIADGAYRVQRKDKDGSKIDVGHRSFGSRSSASATKSSWCNRALSVPDHDKISLSREDKTSRLKALLK